MNNIEMQAEIEILWAEGLVEIDDLVNATNLNSLAGEAKTAALEAITIVGKYTGTARNEAISAIRVWVELNIED